MIFNHLHTGTSSPPPPPATRPFRDTGGFRASDSPVPTRRPGTLAASEQIGTPRHLCFHMCPDAEEKIYLCHFQTSKQLMLIATPTILGQFGAGKEIPSALSLRNHFTASVESWLCLLSPCPAEGLCKAQSPWGKPALLGAGFMEGASRSFSDQAFAEKAREQP